MRNVCGYERFEGAETDEVTRYSEEERERRKNHEKDALKAAEMDRISKGCMKSGIEALKELQMGKACSQTKGFRSYALSNRRVQEAAIRNGEGTEAMVHIANKESKKSSVSNEKPEQLTRKTLERKEEEEERENGRQHKTVCTGCHKKGHGYKQCPCRGFIKSKGRSREREESENSEEDGEMYREESNTTRKAAKARKINGTIGNALPTFQIEADMKGGNKATDGGNGRNRRSLLGNRGGLAPDKSIRQAMRCARTLPPVRNKTS